MDNNMKDAQNKALENMINKYDYRDLDVSDTDYNDIEYVKSNNFITRGSMFKNSSFNDKKITNESEKNYN